MKRRTLLRAVAAASAAGIAGCTGTGPGGGGPADSPTDSPTGTPADSPTGTPADSPTDTPTPTPTPGPPELTGQSFEVLDKGCGTGTDRATVKRNDQTVTVTGVISGSNGCYTAELERARYDAGADELRVNVRSFDPGDEAACMQCIVDIDYRATFEFEGGRPGSVTVRHNGERVRTATPAN